MVDVKRAAARASVSRPSEIWVVGEASFLPLEKGDSIGEANSLVDAESNAADDLQQQFHTSPHWQGFNREATAEKTGENLTDQLPKATNDDEIYLSGVDEPRQSASYLKRKRRL